MKPRKYWREMVGFMVLRIREDINLSEGEIINKAKSLNYVHDIKNSKKPKP